MSFSLPTRLFEAETPQNRWRKRNPKKVNDLKRAWRTANPHKAQEEHRRRYDKDPEKERARTKKYRVEDPDRWRNIKLKKFGLTVTDYDAMHAAQKGLCAICERTNIEKRRLAVDHCHATGKVRGLLYGSCNKALGLFRDDHAVLKRALAYLKKG